ncbi:hypothetical protein HDK77DRAFT_429316 [Phyllosticta capitalensis]|uniref:Uncharacterized protein n=1 Tax=Phyllosticta capitalensis TaxID=121624 RepID=A0ABR1YIP9_9PEZI
MVMWPWDPLEHWSPQTYLKDLNKDDFDNRIITACHEIELEMRSFEEYRDEVVGYSEKYESAMQALQKMTKGGWLDDESLSRAQRIFANEAREDDVPPLPHDDIRLAIEALGTRTTDPDILEVNDRIALAQQKNWELRKLMEDLNRVTTAVSVQATREAGAVGEKKREEEYEKQGTWSKICALPRRAQSLLLRKSSLRSFELKYVNMYGREIQLENNEKSPPPKSTDFTW